MVTLDGICSTHAGYISGGQPQASRPFILGYERDMETDPEGDGPHPPLARRSPNAKSKCSATAASRPRRRSAAFRSEAEKVLDKRQKLQSSSRSGSRSWRNCGARCAGSWARRQPARAAEGAGAGGRAARESSARRCLSRREESAGTAKYPRARRTASSSRTRRR